MRRGVGPLQAITVGPDRVTFPVLTPGKDTSHLALYGSSFGPSEVTEQGAR